VLTILEAPDSHDLEFTCRDLGLRSPRRIGQEAERGVAADRDRHNACPGSAAQPAAPEAELGPSAETDQPFEGLDMSVHLRYLAVASLLVFLFPCQRLAAQEDVADITSQDLRADKDENKRCFLVGPQKGTTAPKKGYGLLVVLPGGDGSADFQPFVKRIYKNAVPEGYR
jgi:hypothetical protein